MRLRVAGEPYADISVDGFIAGEADFDDQRRRCALMYMKIDVGFDADGSMNLVVDVIPRGFVSSFDRRGKECAALENAMGNQLTGLSRAAV
ncbi:hypothetical protein [Caballeronia sp. LZ001]|uniref:hypothetical protein n=1 Tax=Caballeronia sp. LZ001 TaxID=3038553 RepID=UPI0028541ECD|nr:hypothetical protein [Caballeronia sp. LZ001]MDR5806003.1 hypothetical protein [Caballeronia sp. LZ001]